MRALALVTAFIGLLAAGPASATHATAKPAGFPEASLQQCATGPAADDRAAVFVGRMRAIPGGERLQLRFRLQERRSERGRWTTVGGQPLGTWSTADPGVRGYVFTKRVERLGAPGAYRVLVQFRWLSPAGEVVHRATRTSSVCRQPDFRPNLRPVAIDVLPAGDGRSRYRVTVANDGQGAGAAFELALRVAGQSLAPVMAPQIDRGRSTAIELEGPSCPAGGTVGAVVDSAGTVVEQREGDNALELACPSGAVAPSLY
jgi:hypothetical protein